MADTSTTHLHLVKQDPNSLPDYEKDHGNLDTLDTEIWARAKTFNGESVGNDGGFHIDSIPNADNLKSSMGQNDTDTYIIRTSGGEASIEDEGSSWLMSIKGNYVKTGHVDRIVNMTVSPVGEDDHITATIDEDTYESQMTQDGTTVFTYSTGWNLDPATYGITVTGEPVAGDVIQVVYAKEIPGTIAQSYPVKFVSTGWNLYDHANRRARLIKYSEQYNFKISGAYTSLEFVDSATGNTTVISPVSGAFALPAGSEGGVLNVNGGDATTTAIWMTWSDWVSGYRWKNGAQGAFQAYTESVIDMTAYMAQKFSNGLLAVGTVKDEINFNVGIALSRVERMENDASGVNKAAAKASGRQYDYDANWVYLERATPIEYDLTYTIPNDEAELDGTYTSDDHGLEMFTNTTVEVTANALYGQNLKNKLERNVVTISNQDIEPAQQAQVRENIGAASDEDYEKVIPIGHVGSIAALVDRVKAVGQNRMVLFTLSSANSQLLSGVAGSGFGLAKNLADISRVDYVVFQPSAGSSIEGTIDMTSNAVTIQKGSVASPVTWDSTTSNTANCSATMYKMGKLRVLDITVNPKTCQSSWSTYGVVASGHRPVTDIYVMANVVNGSAHAQTVRLTTGGAIRMIGSSISLNESYHTSFFYMVP